MRRFLRHLAKFCIVLASASLLTMAAAPGLAEANEADFNYKVLDDGEVEITGYKGKSPHVVIPDKIDGLPVTSIAPLAFKDKEIESVEIPESVSNIGYNAFSGNKLTSVRIPPKVTHIKGATFSGNQLSSVEIPENVTIIEDNAFSGNRLTTVEIPDIVEYIGMHAFSGNRLESVTIPSSVIFVGGFAFAGNRLTSVQIQEGVKTIGSGLFYSNQLTSVELPSSLTEIGDDTFNSNQLTSVTIPPNVTRIGAHAFANNRLTNLVISESVKEIGEQAFANNVLTSVEFPSSVKHIGLGAFANNYLTSVEVPETVTRIESSAFTNNPALVYAVVRNDTVELGSGPIFGIETTTIIASNTSNGKKHAEERNQPFIDIQNTAPDRIGFHPDGRGGDWYRDIDVTVTIKEPYLPEAHYQWSRSPVLPLWSKDDWGTVTSDNSVAGPSEHGTWYLHVLVETAENGRWSGQAPFRIDAVEPEIVVDQVSGDGADQKAALKVTATDKDSGVDVVKYAFGRFDAAYFEADGETLELTDGQGTIPVTDNGWATVYARDKAGNEKVAQVEVTDLDRTAPSLVLTLSTTEPTDQDVIVNVSVTDNSGGPVVTKWAYGQFDETWFRQNGTVFSDRFSAQMNGTYTVYAADSAGNSVIETITVTNIFKTVPSVFLTPMPTEPTNQHVTVTVNVYAESGLTAVKYAFGRFEAAYFEAAGETLELTGGQGTIPVTDNGWVTVYAQDKVGKETVATAEITNIDREKPVIGLKGNSTVRISLGSKYAEPGYTAHDNLDGDITAQVLVSGDTVDTSREGNYTILYDVKDRAGNEADQVRRIVTVYRSTTTPGESPPSDDPGYVTPPPATDKEQESQEEIVGEDIPTDGAPAEPPRDDGGTEQSVPDFNDTAGHWASEDIQRAARISLVNGYPDGTFQPDRSINRAEFLVLLMRALNLAESGEAAPGGATANDAAPASELLSFTDANRIGLWAREAIAKAVGLGIVFGYSDGTFQPDRPITRAEMAVMIARALGFALEEKTVTDFADDADIPDWAKGAVEVLRKENLIFGRDDARFAPDSPATRAESIVILLRMLDMLIEK